MILMPTIRMPPTFQDLLLRFLTWWMLRCALRSSIFDLQYACCYPLVKTLFRNSRSHPKRIRKRRHRQNHWPLHCFDHNTSILPRLFRKICWHETKTKCFQIHSRGAILKKHINDCWFHKSQKSSAPTGDMTMFMTLRMCNYKIYKYIHTHWQ